jgi:NADH:ubiquinone oxidoreductase subunit C
MLERGLDFPRIKYFFDSISSKFLFCVTKQLSLEFYLKKEDFLFFLNFIKSSSALLFNILIDISVVDLQTVINRFKITYNLLSVTLWKRLSFNYFLNELDFGVSAKKLFSVADWIEREIWDMFGIYFINHNDLRRILTDYGFKGFPLKKDFPLTGYLEVRFDDSKRDVCYEPLELTQELRFFNFASGWERE